MSKLRSVAVVAGAVVAAGAAHAQAADPLAGAFDTMTTQVTTYGAAAGGLLLVVLGLTIGMKLVKKLANKAT